MKRYERDGRWVEVGNLCYSFFNRQPCYEVDGRGDILFYLDDTPPLRIEERPDGSWTIQYIPDDDNFPEYAQALIRLGEWK